ncbi:dihydropteroate synthase [Kangiella aquimarina]|uniref:Dihydropteroate synthase n=1 Tax=Kangiella aquimarina TaxID=261965 RepID=A0ABZ0X662_9GAMM|nr:dihydropteroate synthase [Kangiella aquimarina]WQG85886.1 dihydropteroate synthase [Kangiella aquimarina]
MKDLFKSNAPLVMGILNTTPDSFSDGGNYVRKDIALRRIEAMISEGVDIIDVGGESTRPGAQAVSESEELDRVIPIVEAVVASGMPVSVDTSKAKVMKEAISAGATMINDVRALQEEGAIDAVSADGKILVCLMHMQGQPRSMQHNPQYDDVVTDVKAFLLERVAACQKRGIESGRICLDPGFGFGKTLQHNCELMKHLDSFKELNLPLLVGVSRKTMIGNILDADVNSRVNGSVVAAMYALTKGAKILRVHDVKPTVEAVKLFCAFEQGK